MTRRRRCVSVATSLAELGGAGDVSFRQSGQSMGCSWMRRFIPADALGHTKLQPAKPVAANAWPKRDPHCGHGKNGGTASGACCVEDDQHHAEAASFALKLGRGARLESHRSSHVGQRSQETCRMSPTRHHTVTPSDAQAFHESLCGQPPLHHASECHSTTVPSQLTAAGRFQHAMARFANPASKRDGNYSFDRTSLTFFEESSRCSSWSRRPHASPLGICLPFPPSPCIETM